MLRFATSLPVAGQRKACIRGDQEHIIAASARRCRARTDAAPTVQSGLFNAGTELAGPLAGIVEDASFMLERDRSRFIDIHEARQARVAMAQNAASAGLVFRLISFAHWATAFAVAEP